MTTQGQSPTNEPVDNGEILAAVLEIQRSEDETIRSMRNIQKELMGFKKLVLTELIAIKQVVLPEPPRVTEEAAPSPTEKSGTTDNPTASETSTAEDLTSDFVRAGASLTEAPAPARQEIPDQPMLPDAQDRGCDREMTPLEC